MEIPNWTEAQAATMQTLLTFAALLIAIAIPAIQRIFDRRKEIEQERNRIKGYLEAIRTEINVAWKQYNDRIGFSLEHLEENLPFLMVFPIYSDFFSVYHGNSEAITHLPTRRLREQIVKTYMLAKGQLDSFQYNNVCVQKVWELEAMRSEYNVQNRLNVLMQDLTDYARKLKYGHNELLIQVGSLNKEIEDAIS